MIVTHCKSCAGSGIVHTRKFGTDFDVDTCVDCDGSGHIVILEQKADVFNDTEDTPVHVPNIQAEVNPVDHMLCSGFDETCPDSPCLDCDLNE